MSKTTVAIVILVVALMGSNTWWAFRMLDAGVSYTYQGVALDDNQQALKQVLAVIKASNSANATREMIIAAAQAAVPSDPFEKDGFVWVGKVGLRFDEGGRLMEAVPAWN